MAKPVALANFGVTVEIWNEVTNFAERETFRFEDENQRDEFVAWLIQTPDVNIDGSRIYKFVETVFPDVASARERARYVKTRKIND